MELAHDQQHAVVTRKVAGSIRRPHQRIEQLEPPHPATAELPRKLLDLIGHHTDPQSAALESLELVTGLTPDLIWLVAPDQISATSLLGRGIPEHFKSLYKALALAGGWKAERPAQVSKRYRQAVYNDLPEQFACVVADLLRSGPGGAVSSDLPAPLRTRMEDLRRLGIVTLLRDAYRLTDIAKFSAYKVHRAPAYVDHAHASNDMQRSFWGPAPERPPIDG